MVIGDTSSPPWGTVPCYLDTSTAEHDVMKAELTEAGREQVAFALLLLKDYKCDGKFDIDHNMTILKLAEHLGVLEEYRNLQPRVPPMRIVERYPDNG